MRVSEVVRREVQGRFAPNAARDLLALLETTEIPFLDPPDRADERARVHLAILLYANGDVERARRGVELAATDWRDLLIAAGMEHANWPDVLRNAGFPVP
jgi:hypothetical protein